MDNECTAAIPQTASSKDEKASRSIARLSEVLSHLDSLADRVLGNPTKVETPDELNLSLSAILGELPQRLDEFVSQAHAKLDELESILF